MKGNSCSNLTWLRALSLFDQLTLPNWRLLQAAYVHRFRFDAGSSPALFPHGGSGPIVSLPAFDAAAEARGVGQTGSAMGTREELATHLWDEIINVNLEPTGIDDVVAACERRPNDPLADVGPAIMRMLEAGVSRDDICLVRRAAAYEAVFGTLYALGEPGVDNDDVLMLHEELLAADPTGMEGRPGSATQWMKSQVD